MKIQFDKIFRDLLVIDIETASAFEDYSDMDDRMQSLWDKKASYMQKTDKVPRKNFTLTKGRFMQNLEK